MYSWSYKYTYTGISISTKSNLHVSSKVWPTLINESLTVSHDIRKLAGGACKELNLENQPLGVPKARTKARVGGWQVPGSPCAGRARRERAWCARWRQQRALRRYRLPQQDRLCGSAVGSLPFSWGPEQLVRIQCLEHVVSGMGSAPSVSGGLHYHVWADDLTAYQFLLWFYRRFTRFGFTGLALAARVCWTIVRSCLENTSHRGQVVVGTSGTKTRSKAPQHWTSSWTNCGLTLRIGAYNPRVVLWVFNNHDH